MIVSIDGPSGAGKSSVAKEVATKLGFSCLDTGAMYRCIALRVLRDGVSLDDVEKINQIASSCKIDFHHEQGNPSPAKILLDGEDVSDAIRSSEVDCAVSPVSAMPEVREALVSQQRRIGSTGDYVVEGRDIGTVVFPHAEVKVFLTASNEARAHRRALQNMQRGIGLTDFDKVLADIVRRDEYDSSRSVSPLKPAKDAVLIDSSSLSIEEVVDWICSLVSKQ